MGTPCPPPAHDEGTQARREGALKRGEQGTPGHPAGTCGCDTWRQMLGRLLHTAVPTAGSFAAAFQHPLSLSFGRACFSLNRVLQTRGAEPAAWLGVPPQTRPSSSRAVSPHVLYPQKPGSKTAKGTSCRAHDRIPSLTCQVFAGERNNSPHASRGRGVRNPQACC